MTHRLLVPSLAVVFMGAVALVGWKAFGGPGLAIAILVASPVLGIAFAAPILSLLGGSVTLARTIAYRDIEGRHFEYKGHIIDVREDLTGTRWLRVEDVRRIVPHLPQARTLQNTIPDGLGHLESPRVLRVNAKALDAYLKKSNSQSSIRFRVWLQREVIYPSERTSRQHQRSATPAGAIDEAP